VYQWACVSREKFAGKFDIAMFLRRQTIYEEPDPLYEADFVPTVICHPIVDGLMFY
jgi:hypothetical protein